MNSVLIIDDEPGSRPVLSDSFQAEAYDVCVAADGGEGLELLDQRDIDLYKAILSGDLAGNDGSGFINNEENSCHVVSGSDTNSTALIDGFTINGGNGDASCGDDGRGGGLVEIFELPEKIRHRPVGFVDERGGKHQ